MQQVFKGVIFPRAQRLVERVAHVAQYIFSTTTGFRNSKMYPYVTLPYASVTVSWYIFHRK